MVVQAIGTTTRKRDVEDIVHAEPVSRVTDVAEVSPDPSNAGGATHVAKPADSNVERFAVELNAKSPRTDRAMPARIGAFAIPKVVVDLVKKGVDQFTVHPAKSFFELPGDVQDAVKDEMKKWPSGSKAYKDIVHLATSDGFLQHSPVVQKAMVAGISKFPKDADFHKEMFKLASDPNFQALPENEKLAVVNGFIANGADKDARQTIARMVTLEGFKNVADADRAALIAHVAGTDYFGDRGREMMKKLLDHPDFGTKSTAEQTDILKRFVDAGLFVPDHVWPKDDAFKDELPYTISKPKKADDHKFYTGKADATRYDVTIDGQTIPVYMAKKTDKDLIPPTIDEVAESLASLPADSRKLIKRIDVEPHRDKDDAANAKKSGDPDFRAWMADDASGVMNIFPTPTGHDHASMVGAMIHETGHTLSRSAWGDDSASGKKWQAWRDAMAGDGPPPSKYGGFTNDEDFAETFALYVETKGTPLEDQARKTFPARFALIDQLLEKEHQKAAQVKK